MSKEMISKGLSLVKNCECNKKAIAVGYLAFVGIASIISLADIIKRRRIEKRVERAVDLCFDELLEKSLSESKDSDGEDSADNVFCDFDCDCCDIDC